MGELEDVKQRVLEWRRQFFREHGRNPTSPADLSPIQGDLNLLKSLKHKPLVDLARPFQQPPRPKPAQVKVAFVSDPLPRAPARVPSIQPVACREPVAEPPSFVPDPLQQLVRPLSGKRGSIFDKPKTAALPAAGSRELDDAVSARSSDEERPVGAASNEWEWSDDQSEGGSEKKSRQGPRELVTEGGFVSERTGLGTDRWGNENFVRLDLRGKRWRRKRQRGVVTARRHAFDRKWARTGNEERRGPAGHVEVMGDPASKDYDVVEACIDALHHREEAAHDEPALSLVPEASGGEPRLVERELLAAPRQETVLSSSAGASAKGPVVGAMMGHRLLVPVSAEDAEAIARYSTPTADKPLVPKRSTRRASASLARVKRIVPSAPRVAWRPPATGPRGYPLCPMHGVEAALRTVKKSGRNRGRKFYCCPLPAGEQCNYFCWKEDHCVSAVKEFLTEAKRVGNGDPAAAAGLRLSAGRLRWSTKTVGQLLQVVRERGIDRRRTSSSRHLAEEKEDVEAVEDEEEDVSEDDDVSEVDEEGVASSLICESDLVSVDEEEVGESPIHVGGVPGSVIPAPPKTQPGQKPKPSVVPYPPGEMPVPPSSLSSLRKIQLVELLAADDAWRASKEFVRLKEHQRGVPREPAVQQSSVRHDDDNDSDEEDNRELARMADDRSPALQVLQDDVGLASFREGQEWAINRVLDGKSTLLVAATGSGKSLTFQIPALMFARGVPVTSSAPPPVGNPRWFQEGRLCKGITIVISPLIALMEDQMTRLPPPLIGVALAGRQPAHSLAEALTSLRTGCCHVLFMSPERLFSPSFRKLARDPSVFPPVALAVIDEAHCVTEWGHNFRPAYLRLRQTLTDLVKPRCFLALTATATPSTVRGIQSVLQIPDEGVRVGSWERLNLRLSASKEQGDQRPRALVQLLTDEASPLSKAKAKSVIVYTQTQREAEAVADGLASRGVSAAAYHAGMGPTQRSRVQQRFLGGSLRVVVATVAFGLGIDKADVRGVVHWGAPRSPEDYLQQVGRAGRDGGPAHCHAFLSPAELPRIRALSAGEGMTSKQAACLAMALGGASSRLERALEHARDAVMEHKGKGSLWSSGRGRSHPGDPFELRRGLCTTPPRPPEGASSWLESEQCVPIAVDLWWCKDALGLAPEVVETALSYLEAAGLAQVLEPLYATIDVTLVRRTAHEACDLSPAIGASVCLAREVEGSDEVVTSPQSVTWQNSRGLWVVRVDVCWAAALMMCTPREVLSQLLSLRDAGEARLDFSGWSQAVRLIGRRSLLRVGTVQEGATCQDVVRMAVRVVSDKARSLRAGSAARVESAWAMLFRVGSDSWRDAMRVRAAKRQRESPVRDPLKLVAPTDEEVELFSLDEDRPKRPKLAAPPPPAEECPSSPDSVLSERGESSSLRGLLASYFAAGPTSVAASLSEELKLALRAIPPSALHKDTFHDTVNRLSDLVREGKSKSRVLVQLCDIVPSLEDDMRSRITAPAGPLETCLRITIGEQATFTPARLLALGLGDMLATGSESRWSVTLEALASAQCTPQAASRILTGVSSVSFPPTTWRLERAWEAGAAFRTEQLEQLCLASGWGVRRADPFGGLSDAIDSIE
jgi:RecQ family ATP-dependent DNA helicase